MPASDTEILLDARGIGRRLGPIGSQGGVRGIDISLRRGDVLGLLGLNGAGKSTTLKLLAGVLAPGEGDVGIAGFSLRDEPLEARARLGYLPDTPPLYADMTVHQNVLLAARLRRLRGAKARAAADAIADTCHLGELNDRRVAHLSKGQRQRVGLAQALVHDPDVLLLDEPGSGLDPQQTDELRAVIREAGQRHCVVFSTHLLHEAQRVCNRVAVIHHGRMVAEHPANGTDLETLFARLAQGLPDDGADSRVPVGDVEPSADADDAGEGSRP